MIPQQLIDEAKKRMAPYDTEGFVLGQGPEKPALMLIGEAPGETELVEQRPFTGRAGKELMAFLGSLGLSREEVYITSAVRSRPYKWKERKTKSGEITGRFANRTPTKAEVLAHAPILDYEIDRIKPPLLVPIGNIGLQRLLGPGYKISEMHGKKITSPVQKMRDDGAGYGWTTESYDMIPTYHPAAIFYNRSLTEAIANDAEQIQKWLANQKPPR